MISWFRGKKILFQLLSGFGIVCLLFIIVSFYINSLNKNTANEIDAAHKEVLPHTLNFIEIKRDIEQIQQWLTDISATRAAEGYDDGYSEADNFYVDCNKRIDHAIVEHERYGEDEVVSLLKEFKADVADYYAMGKRMAQAYIDGGPEVGNPMMAEFDPYAVKVSSLMDKLVEEHLTELDNLFLHMEQDSALTSKTLFIAILCVSIISLLLSLLISHSVTQPICSLEFQTSWSALAGQEVTQ